ncbi:hypothetical protein Aph02nite_85530 [Actinoplanes philippinensis]|nr:hypothetical protein Aph02nite_85530 [Actinoplanes philippinensis]
MRVLATDGDDDDAGGEHRHDLAHGRRHGQFLKGHRCSRPRGLTIDRNRPVAVGIHPEVIVWQSHAPAATYRAETAHCRAEGGPPVTSGRRRPVPADADEESR